MFRSPLLLLYDTPRPSLNVLFLGFVQDTVLRDYFYLRIGLYWVFRHRVFTDSCIKPSTLCKRGVLFLCGGNSVQEFDRVCTYTRGDTRNAPR